MSDKPKHKQKEKDKRRKEGKEQEKEAKRLRKEAARDDGNTSDGGKQKKKKKDKDKKEKAPEKKPEAEVQATDQKEKTAVLEEGAGAAKAPAKPDEKKADAPPEKKLKAWQDDELEVDSDEEAKAPAPASSSLAGTTASSSSSSAPPPSTPAPAAAAAGGVAAPSGEAPAPEAKDEEQDTLEAFMADLAKAKLERKPEVKAEDSAPGDGPTGAVDSAPAKTITLEEIEALMGRRSAPLPASPEAAASAAEVAPGSPAEGEGAAAALAADDRRDSEDIEFHAAFVEELRKFRRAGAGPAAEEAAGPSFQAAKSFKGAKPGFVFKKGAFGVGYYRDVAQGAPASPTAAPGSVEGRDAGQEGDVASSSSDEEDEEDATAAAGSPGGASPEAAAASAPQGGETAAAAAAGSAPPPAEPGVEAKLVETKKEKRQKRREAKLAAAKAKALESKKKAKEGFGTELDQLMESDPDMSEQSSEPEQESYFDLVKRFTTKKSLPAVDHSKIEYAPFKKNIYIQVKEITNMKEHEVDDFRRMHGGIKVRGKNCPRPIKNFLQCGLPDRILKIIERRDYECPFPIQMQAIPALMCGRDMIGVAQTGSGKTLAYLLPAIRHMLDQPPLKDGDGPIAFAVAPTRELALQIQREANVFCKAVGLTSVCAYGGGPMGEQLAALKRGAEFLVGTPGRLIDVLTISNGKITNLRRVTFLVLDEADRMFDMGFEPQIGMFLQTTRPDKQVAMFSATLPSHVEALARQVLKRPLEITVGERNTAAANVTQFVEVLEETQKFYRLLQLLGEWHEHGSIIIFVQQQKDVDELFTELLKYGYPSLALHGGQDQQDRDFTLQDFKDGVASILVATSVAARGIDVKQVVLVINFKVPEHLEDYIHRIGRTGRAGKHGYAYTFIQPDEGEHAQDMLDALRQCSQPVPEKLKRLVEDHQAQVNTGQAKKKRRWSGFGGKGFKYDNTEKSQQMRDRERAKSDLLIGDRHEREEEDETFRDPWNEDKPMSKQGQDKRKDDRPADAKPAPTAASTVAAAAAVAAKMQAEAAKAAAPGAAPTPGVGSNPAEFIPATAFTGARPGMSFKMGPKGLGYYLDAGAEAAAAAAAAVAPPPPPPPPPPGASAAAAKTAAPLRRRSDMELEEEARRMAEKTLQSLLEGENGDAVREKQLPALTAKLKEKLRKADEEQVQKAAAAAKPPPPPKPAAPAPADSLLVQALPLVPGVLGVGGRNDMSMVVRSMEQLQDKASKTIQQTQQEAAEMAALIASGSTIAPLGKFVEEFEINDYPQIARQKISHRDPLLAIEEMTGAKCWVKGQYFADERKMPDGARKLYVEISGPTTISVQKAKYEVKKMMEALAIRTLNIPGVSRAVMGTPGRYDPAVGM